MQTKKSRFSENFSQRLLSVIKHAGLKKSQFAKDIGVSPSNLSDWLSGRYNPNGVVLFRISEKFSININWLMTGEGDMIAEKNEKDVVSVKKHTPDPINWTDVNRSIDGFLLQATEKDVDLIIKRLQLWLDYRRRT